MSRFYGIAALLLTVSLAAVGCGGSSGPTNITEGATMSEFEKYEAMVAADEQAMGANADPGTAGAAAPAAPAAPAAAEEETPAAE